MSAAGSGPYAAPPMDGLPDKKCPKADRRKGPLREHERHAWVAGRYAPAGEVDGWWAACPGLVPASARSGSTPDADS